MVQQNRIVLFLALLLILHVRANDKQDEDDELTTIEQIELCFHIILFIYEYGIVNFILILVIIIIITFILYLLNIDYSAFDGSNKDIIYIGRGVTLYTLFNKKFSD
jgi:hypothetical protein